MKKGIARVPARNSSYRPDPETSKAMVSSERGSLWRVRAGDVDLAVGEKGQVREAVNVSGEVVSLGADLESRPREISCEGMSDPDSDNSNKGLNFDKVPGFSIL